MPAKSKAQRRLMGACSHGADWESCPKGMTRKQMSEFAGTKEKGLPMRKSKKKESGNPLGKLLGR